MLKHYISNDKVIIASPLSLCLFKNNFDNFLIVSTLVTCKVDKLNGPVVERKTYVKICLWLGLICFENAAELAFSLGMIKMYF